jgi:transcriptional regulator with GAF, ATPase, and Fis domain
MWFTERFHSNALVTRGHRQKIGRFEMADEGTLFLDEVGDIPPALQPKLLRVMQEPNSSV